MVKKEAKKEIQKKKSTQSIEQALLENFVTLQKVLTKFSLKFEKISKDLDELLGLFKESAQSFEEKYPGGMDKDHEELSSRLDTLIDQNKKIQNTLSMIEGRTRKQPPTNAPPTRPLPRI